MDKLLLGNYIKIQQSELHLNIKEFFNSKYT